MNAAAGYIGNAIQELMVVKKEAAQPRILPSISNMKVVSKTFDQLGENFYSFL